MFKNNFWTSEMFKPNATMITKTTVDATMNVIS